MTDKFSALPTTLAALLRKLADPAISVRDIASERLDWYRAGCPVLNDRKHESDCGCKSCMGM